MDDLSFLRAPYNQNLHSKDLMVQLYTQCPNCGNRLFYTKSAVELKIPRERSLHYCASCGYHNGKLESMTCA